MLEVMPVLLGWRFHSCICWHTSPATSYYIIGSCLGRFGARPEVGPSLGGYRGVARASAHRASSGQISLLREGEDVWNWFPAAETTSQAAVPTEPEAAQTLLGPMGSRGLGEN